MPHDYRSSNRSHQDDRPHRRTVHRRTNKRQTVQSDELSSTNGARLVSRDNPYDPSKNPHLSSTSLPAISASGVPHPKSPAARAQQRAAHENRHPSLTGEHLPVSGTHTGERVHAGHTGAFLAVKPADLPPAQPTGAIPTTPSASDTRSAAPIRSNASERHMSLPNIDPVRGDTPAEPKLGEPGGTGSYGALRGDLPSEAGAFAQHEESASASVQDDASAPAEQTVHTSRDYSAASGRYKAHSSRPENTSGFKPIFADAQHSRRRTKRTWPRIVAAVAILFAVGFGGYFIIDQVAYASPVEATVNGETMTLEGKDRTINGLLDDGLVNVTPGNFVAVDNSVLHEGEGTRCSVLINEQQVTDLSTHINEGDQVVISNGTDVMEAYTDSDPITIPAGYSKAGTYGALHVFLPGQDGEQVTRTGSESGISVQQMAVEKIDDRLAYYNANSNGRKIVALTFDDGPWDSSTEQILDILKEYDAKATFYTIGQQVSAHSDQIKRMADEGHEIATHTWDHADGSGKGVSLDLMSTDERRAEVEKGLAIIEEVSGKEASTYFRAPGGNFGESTANDLKDLVTGEIGWNIDTEDWRRPGADVIAERIKSVQPGGIVLMHDGGGDRSQTVAALRDALAYLADQGYEFVTISELIEACPYQDTTNS